MQRISIIIVILSLAVSDSAFAMRGVWIGTEWGPEYTVAGGFIDEANHTVFIDSNYFFGTLSEGGFTYNRAHTHDMYGEINFVHDNNQGMEAYARIADDLDLPLLLNATATAGGYWKADRVPRRIVDSLKTWDSYRNDMLTPWDPDGDRITFLYEDDQGYWHGPAMGNAVKDTTIEAEQEEALERCWYTNKNSSGFIIGDPQEDASNDLEDNWCRVKSYFMFYQHGFENWRDRYHIFLLMKLADGNFNQNDTLLMFHFKRENNSQRDSVAVTAGELSTQEWRWIEFHPQMTLNSWDRFALRWLGTPQAGKVKFARIAYSSDKAWTLFSGDLEHVTEQGMQNTIFNEFESQLDALQDGGMDLGNVLGWINWEPFWFAQKTHRDVVGFFKGDDHWNGIGNYRDFTFTAQIAGAYKDLGNDLYSEFVDRTEVPSLVVDLFPIRAWGSNWIWEQSENGDDDPMDGISVQVAWDWYIKGIDDPWPYIWAHNSQGRCSICRGGKRLYCSSGTRPWGITG